MPGSVCIKGCYNAARKRPCRKLPAKNNKAVSGLRYGLDGPGIQSRWGQDFPHVSRPAVKPIQPPVQWVPGLSRGGGGKAAGS